MHAVKEDMKEISKLYGVPLINLDIAEMGMDLLNLVMTYVHLLDSELEDIDYNGELDPSIPSMIMKRLDDITIVRILERIKAVEYVYPEGLVLVFIPHITLLLSREETYQALKVLIKNYVKNPVRKRVVMIAPDITYLGGKIIHDEIGHPPSVVYVPFPS
ncbi:hypothetical protein Pyrfu_1905 [Pyrolobus fumarii 1A]|uniref:Uncharacterized protein n=1 Tax=Pyrolobus fumarii (strain DSM 11204 / 1A) TaxID=694429 RepID=G0ED80_PYRF1|nr:hypothetical protein [Pyrolobus fumarii]AEM39758.1 hypothetical protein Pyrfu_1905 [Pyrolobus fumarii 1A]